LVVGADQRRRASEAARLRALGLARGQTRRLLLAEHFLLLAPVIVLGWLVGATATWALGPPLVRSDLGGAPVPDAAVVWPWADEGLLLGGVLVACTIVCVVIAILQVRRSHPGLLRTDEW
jgi:predicted lysophospholipase L1 biosynthesis ABC-type transport system permease subunit